MVSMKRTWVVCVAASLMMASFLGCGGRQNLLLPPDDTDAGEATAATIGPIDRYPAIAAAAAKLRAKPFTLDGEAAVTGGDGVAVFDALHRRHKAAAAMLYVFDLLELDGKNLRPLPLGERTAKWRGCRRGLPPASGGPDGDWRYDTVR